MKKLISLMLAVCLCLACLPLPAGAAVSQTDLEKFLTRLEDFADFNSENKGFAFDANKVMSSGYGNYMAEILTLTRFNCLDHDQYPGYAGSIVEMGEHDPLGRWDQYAMIKEDFFHWELENILNISPANIAKMKKDFIDKKDPYQYYYNGAYYFMDGGIGGPGVWAHVTGTQELTGGRVGVTYYCSYDGGMGGRDERYPFYAVVEEKDIGGSRCWTIHYNGYLKDGRNPLASGGFVDVPAGSYFTEPIKWAVENGITNGTGTATFSPNASCTRAQAVMFLWNAAGQPEPESSVEPFTDVSPSDWYYKAVLWAVDNGITSGVGANKFGPGQTCTRGQIVTFLWRAKNQPFAGSAGGFSDVPKGSYFETAVNWAVEEGITTGVGNGRFNPNGTCTRGQIATFLYRSSDVPQADPMESCLEAYAYFLRNYNGIEKNWDPKFQLIYLDDNDIPELVVAQANYFASPAELYTYWNGQVKKLEVSGRTGFGYYGTMAYGKRTGLIIDESARQGFVDTDYFRLSNGKVEDLHMSFTRLLEGPERPADQFFLNDVEITKSEYDSKRAEIENGCTHSLASYDDGYDINETNIQRMLADPSNVMGE